MKFVKILVLGCVLFFTSAYAVNNNVLHQDNKLPKVFVIGEHEGAYNQLLLDYETLLLAACDDDMALAYDKWMGMMRDMEAYSEKINFDLKGTKFWLNVFWENDGTIKHIAYYLKPNSRNIDPLELNAFLASFIKNYKFALTTEMKYSHYGGAAFPLFPTRIGK